MRDRTYYEFKDHLGNIRATFGGESLQGTLSTANFTYTYDPSQSGTYAGYAWVENADCEGLTLQSPHSYWPDNEDPAIIGRTLAWQTSSTGTTYAGVKQLDVSSSGLYYLRMKIEYTDGSVTWVTLYQAYVSIGDCGGNDPVATLGGHADYYPFGLKIEDSNLDYRYGYQGEFAEEDDETGFNHFELRNYDPVVGRWLSTDPAGQHASPYLSFSNNPINRVDPDGGWDKFKMDADGNITRTEVDLTDPYDHLYDVDGNLIAGNIRKGVLDDGQNFLTKFNMIDLTFDELSMDIPNSASAQSFVLQLSMHLEKEIAGFQMSSDNGVKLVVVPSAMNDFKTSRSITWLESRSGKIWTRYASKDVLFKGQEFKMISWFHTHPGKAGVDWSGDVKPSRGDQTWTNNFGVPGHIYGGKGGFNTIYPTK